MNVLLVTPRLKSMFGDPQAVPGHPHTGMAYLSAFLKSKGVHVEVHEEAFHADRSLRTVMRQGDFDLIGVTAFSYSLRYVYETTERIKQCTSTPVVVGGPHVSVAGASIFKEASVDFAVKHEGEYTLWELLQQITSPQPDYGAVAGVYWKNGDDIIENTDRPLISDLDSLPYPDYDAYPLELYPCGRDKEKFLPLITQRGCPYQCTFCSVPVSMGRLFRPRTPESVLAEVEHWHARGVRHFQINDDVYNIDRKRTNAISDLLIERKLGITYELYNGIRANTTDRTQLTKMKASGCTLISFGLESGDEHVLRYGIKKGLTLEQLQTAVTLAGEVGITHSVNFIVGHPEETYEAALRSIEFAKQLPANYVNFYNHTPYPNTESWDWVKEHGRILQPEFLTDVSYRNDEPIFDTPEFTRQQRKEVLRKGFQLYERKVLQYRMGRVLGSVAYYLSRPAVLNRLGRKFVTDNFIGRAVFNWLFFAVRGRPFSGRGGMVVSLDQTET